MKSILGSKKQRSRSRSIPDVLPDVVAHANQLIVKEKYEGNIEACLMREDKTEPILPWKNRYFKLENGMLFCFDNQGDSTPCYQGHASEFETVTTQPFQLTFTKEGVLFVFGFQFIDNEQMENWVKYINAAKQLSHLSSSSAFAAKQLAPTLIFTNPERLKNIMVFPIQTENINELLHETTTTALVEILSPTYSEKKRRSDLFSVKIDRNSLHSVDSNEFENYYEILKNDSIVSSWVEFVKHLFDNFESLKEYELVSGSEIFIDTFPSVGEAFNQSIALLKCYYKAKSNPEKHSEEFKDQCKELEVFSSFCSNKDYGTKQLHKKEKSMKDPSRIASLLLLYSRPLEAILDFSRSMKEYFEANQNPQNEYLNEASAILEDVHDNIIQVQKLIEDWSKTNENKYLQDFLSPAKRTLYYIDSTLDFPLLLFDDFIILLDVNDESGTDVHHCHEKIPLALLEMEENGKFTTFKAPALNVNCKVKSPNNRAANLLRKKIIDAKSRFLTMLCIEMTSVKVLPENFPCVRSSIEYDDELILGSDKGMYIFDRKSKEDTLRWILNTDHKISHLELSTDLELIVYSQEEEQHKNMFTYPLIGLGAYPAVQKHIYPEKVITESKNDNFASYDFEGARRVIATSGKTLAKYSYDLAANFEKKSGAELEHVPSFVCHTNDETYIGVPPKVFKFNDINDSMNVIYNSKDESVPLNCVVLGKFHIICYSDHAVVQNVVEKSTYSTLVWTDASESFSSIGDHLLIFSKNYIEVRHKDSLWQVKQIIAAHEQNIINANQLYTIVNHEILKLQEMPEIDD